MIRVFVKKDGDKIKKVTIKGHSGYAPRGQDIVCASVSSIVITSVNAMLRLQPNSVIAHHVEGLIEVEVKVNTDEISLLLTNMLSLLKELETEYKKYIKVDE